MTAIRFLQKLTKTWKFHRFSKIFLNFIDFPRFWIIIFRLVKSGNLTFLTIFWNFTKKMKKWIYTGGVHPNDRFSMIFMLQTPVFFRVKVGSVGDETFLRKISEKISLTTAIRFLQNLSKNMEIFKILFFLERFGSFYKNQERIRLLKNEKSDSWWTLWTPTV